jgi:glutaredoxin
MENISKKEYAIDIIIFGSNDCHHCNDVKKEFSDLGIMAKFIDANADENQKMCDDNNVDKLPHIQAIRDGKIIYEKSGPYSAKQFLSEVAYKLTKGSQLFPVTQKKANGCSGCKK